jgi:uncharacterized protein YbjT (DUF2867 family)
MYVITGATGHTGSVAVATLRSQGKRVRAVVRDAAKAEQLARLGAEIVVADLSDQGALARAVEGAAGVYLLSPPDMRSSNFVEERRALTARQVATLASARVPHVVFLSSMGAHLPSGTGPIMTTHNVEEQLRQAGVPSTFVRASYFVENWGAVVHPVKQDGVLPTFIAAERPTSMVSSADIGKTAAQALLDGPRGGRVIELKGPTDPTPREVAATFSKLLGRPIQTVEAPLSAVVPTFTSFGISENVANLYREMYEALASGRLVSAPGESIRGQTSLETTLRTLLG